MPLEVLASPGKRRRGHTEKPKRALTPYVLFIQEKRKEFCGTERGEGRSFSEIMRHLSDMWHTMSTEQKKVYVDRSNLEKQRVANLKAAMQRQSEESEEEQEPAKITPSVEIAKNGLPTKPLSAYL
jgi:hypothetical protein